MEFIIALLVLLGFIIAAALAVALCAYLTGN